MYGSGFTTFAVPYYGVQMQPVNSALNFQPYGAIVNDTTLIIPSGWYGGKQPAPYTNFDFGVMFNPGQLGATVYGNGTVTISMAFFNNGSSNGSTPTPPVTPAGPEQLLAWSISGCSPSTSNPNTTTHCPYSTPTVLTILGGGFSQYAPNNFTVCLGGTNVQAPFNGTIVDDGTLTVTTSEQFYTSANYSTRWGRGGMFVSVVGGTNYDCGQGGLYMRLSITVDFPLPQVTSVSGCTDVGLSTYNCSSNATLTVHGSGFYYFAAPYLGAQMQPVDSVNFPLPTGRTVSDVTVEIPGGWYNGTQPAPYTPFEFGLLFNPGQQPLLSANGTVTVSMAAFNNATSNGSTPTPPVTPTGPDQLLAWSISGCSPSTSNPNATIHCPYSTPTVLTIVGAGFSQYASNNFSVCLGLSRVTAPFNGTILSDTVLTVTTSEQFYLSASGSTQWGQGGTMMFLGGGTDFDCGQAGLVVRLILAVDFPRPKFVRSAAALTSA